MNSLARDWELPRAGIPEAPPPDRPLGLRFRASPKLWKFPGEGNAHPFCCQAARKRARAKNDGKYFWSCAAPRHQSSGGKGTPQRFWVNPIRFHNTMGSQDEYRRPYIGLSGSKSGSQFFFGSYRANLRCGKCCISQNRRKRCWTGFT